MMGAREKLMAEGLMIQKQRERDAIEIKIDRCKKDIDYYSFPHNGIKSIESKKVLQAARELDDLCTKWRNLSDEIEKLKAEI